MLLFTLTASAQNPEARARGLAKDAMEEDYLATNMKSALAKLQTALRVCEKDKCSKELVAKIHANLGIVRSAGLDQHAEAVEDFKKALELDPGVKPDANFLTEAVQKAFDAAKPPPPEEPAAVERPVAVLVEKPWPEQATWNPVPVYVELPEDATAARVVTRYKGPGQRDWKELNLQTHGKGFGGYIPCPAVQKIGELQYFTTAFDANLDRVASAGSAAEPRKVRLKKAIDGRQPSLPDAVPPTPCPRPEEMLSCETNDDCPGHQICANLQCVDEASIEDPDAERNKLVKKNWIGVAFSPDLTIVNGTQDACSQSAQEDGKLGCFYANGLQYTHTPFDPGELKSGFGSGSMRALLFYDRLLGKRMTVGVRLGFALFGHPKRVDGKTFFPLHAEGRFAFFFHKDPFANKGVRPFAFAAAGAAETAARVSTEVTEDNGNLGSREVQLDAYQKGGPIFAGLGGGAQYAVNTRMAMLLELSGRAFFPTFAIGVSPTLGFTYGL